MPTGIYYRSPDQRQAQSERCKKLSEWNKRRKITLSPENKSKLLAGWMKYLREHGHPAKGKKTPPEVRLKQRKARLGKYGGDKHPNWQGGIAEKHNKERHSDEYKLWRKGVFERDSYTCLVCGKVGGELNAHHIKRFNEFPLLRYDVDNGKTLCRKCHYLEHTISVKY